MADFGVRSAVRETLVVNDPTPDQKAQIRSTVREILFLEKPDFGIRAAVRESVVSSDPTPDQRAQVRNVIREMIIRPPWMGVRSTVRETLYIGDTAPLIENYAHSVNSVTISNPQEPIDNILSIMSYAFTFNAAIQQWSDNEFPTGFQEFSQVYGLAVQGKTPEASISLTSDSQVVSTAMQKAEAGLYPVIPEIQSTSNALQVYNLTVISRDIAYVPESGAFVPSSVNIAVQAFVEGIPISPVDVPQVTTLTLAGADYDGIPESPASVTSAFNIAVAAADAEPVPISPMRDSQVINIAVIDADYTGMPTSPATSGQVVTTAVHEWQGPDSVVGAVISAETVTLTVTDTTMDPYVGAVINGQLTHKAVIDTTYPDPSGMVSLWVPAVFNNAVLDADYALASDVSSFTRYAFANTRFTQLAPEAFYPDPGEMYVEASQWFVYQNIEKVVGANVEILPISQTPTPQVLEIVTMRADYPPVSTDEGFQVFLAAGSVLTKTTYPSTVEPASDVTADLVFSEVLTRVDYPGKDEGFSFASANLVTEQVLSTATYGDKDASVSYAKSDLVVEQMLLTAEYLDKDLAQSYLSTSLVVEQVAGAAIYPPKDEVGSAAVVSGITEMLLRRDLSLYGPPPPKRRRNPIVITRYVWSE